MAVMVGAELAFEPVGCQLARGHLRDGGVADQRGDARSSFQHLLSGHADGGLLGEIHADEAHRRIGAELLFQLLDGGGGFLSAAVKHNHLSALAQQNARRLKARAGIGAGDDKGFASEVAETLGRPALRSESEVSHGVLQ